MQRISHWAGRVGAVLVAAAAAFWPGISFAEPAPRAEAIGLKVRGGSAEITIAVTARAAFRAFTLDEPMRVVVDFAGLDWAPELRLGRPGAGPVAGLRHGLFRPGWSRLVIDLAEPAALESAAYERGEGGERLRLRLALVARDAFRAAAGAPEAALWDLRDRQEVEALPRPPGALPVIVIDPGHGGIDPGAVRDPLSEKDISLFAARLIAERLEASGRYVAELTRSDDRFVPLRERVRRAQGSGALALLSIHVNTETSGIASGVSVYSLSDAASDAAAARLAAFENRSDVLAGLDLGGEGDEITRILLDLAQRDTNHRSRALAAALLGRLDRSASLIRSNPHRAAGFEVLKAPDVPSLLIELGFLSNDQDRARMLSRAWVEALAADILAALDAWSGAEAAPRTPAR
ncbi:MAG TPA: N-acetylmuramoyl-L-alanine amidase [Paracoccaceae bacterium]|nr:N-acetylmuramoyl-L-alanine amidase [Paracoccaceae bacterium]